mmetsp:Transcript_8620/g.12723  ORF Transcript_8620/g.12723 Transcript_8620/m.12723 type:complete len:89 (-) Transcript_8620:46-312(-)|eukprot:CAMPEP_0117424244 /NCGR_PEP_ID=MMETSP0758-20121206/4703_1 /TAXON_ID=63605 /ORGANISM="Percolomonas cosmopolitus, Strain AE-1 (ATCC 50343)" /LENGTH=88 /DNA_ID=CAMNT_0005207909 /DNA_START=25 /DNA_END=291 /DNA_ORIENTATION=-
MSDLNAKFDAAAAKAKNFSKKPTNEELLELYALFKQATVGDVNTDRPGMLDFTGKAKWDAWNGKKGVAQDQAKQDYIDLVEKLAGNYA